MTFGALSGWTQPAALAFAGLMALLAMFQAALAAGAPLGRFAWGGGQDRLSAPMRMASVVAIALYGGMAAIVLQKAGLVRVFPLEPRVVSATVWIVAGYLGLGVVMNLISRSVPERLVMTPLALALGLLAAVVALA